MRNLLKRGGPWGWTLGIGMLLMSVTGAARKEARPLPGLGAFGTPITVTGVVSGIPFTWSGFASFSPTTNPAQRTISGTGTFTTGGPAPVPTPTPAPVPAPTPTPAPTPPHTINVKSFGAVGDGVTDDTASCQRALQSAVAGDTVYFPAGTYLLKDQLKWNHPPQASITGDGPTSVLKSVAGQGIYVGTGGEPGGPVTISKLMLQGNHGATMRSTILPTGGIQIFGPQNTVIDNCDFQDVTTAVYDAAPTSGTHVSNCRVNGWARVAFFVEKNGQVTNCKVLQNDPNPAAGNTSHAFYIHGGASHVLIADCEIAGVAKYFLQEYSEQPNTLTDGLQVRRCNVHDCQNGVVLAHSQMGAGDIFNTVIDSCTFTRIAASGILIKDGDGVTVSNNAVSACGSYGIALGVWAPYEPNFSIANVDVFGNTVTGCQIGLMGLASNGGSFSNCRFHGNPVSGNRQDLSIQSVLGLSYSPTAAPAASNRGEIGGR